MRFLLLLALGALLGTGCTADEGRRTSVAEPEVSSDPSIMEVPPSAVSMPPGAYTFSDFQPTITFRVGKGWQSAHGPTDDMFDIWNEAHVTAVGWARPRSIFGAGGEVDVADMTAADAIERLLSNRFVVSAEPIGTSTIDGYQGKHVEFRTREGGRLFRVSSGAFDTIPRSMLMRVTALDVDTDLLLVFVVSTESPHQRNLELADDVIRTVSIRPPG